MTKIEWSVRRSLGSAADFHGRELPTLPELRTDATTRGQVWIHESDQPTLVFGSTQSSDLIDIDAARNAGWAVCRRRSGGGLVVIVPGTHVWVDLIVAKTSPLWDDDIVRAFDWVGERWAATIGELTESAPKVHRDRPLRREAGKLLCFGGLGAGEIEIDGRKVLGLSQRRTRDAARFQTMLEIADHSARLLSFARGPLAALLHSRELDPIGLDPTASRPTLIDPETGTIRHDAIVTALLEQLGVNSGEHPMPPVSQP